MSETTEEAKTKRKPVYNYRFLVLACTHLELVMNEKSHVYQLTHKSRLNRETCFN